MKPAVQCMQCPPSLSAGWVCTQIADCEQFLVIMIFVSSYSLSCPSVTTLTTTHLTLEGVFNLLINDTIIASDI